MKPVGLVCLRLWRGVLWGIGAVYLVSLAPIAAFAQAVPEPAGVTSESASTHSRANLNHDYVLNLRVAPWLAQPSGNATLGSLGTDLDVQDDLGVDDYDIHPSGSVNLRLGRHDFLFDALVMDISATNVVQRSITFGSLTVPVNRSARTDIDLQLYDFRYGYSFFDLKQHGFRFGPTLGVGYLDFDVKVTDQVTGTSDSFAEVIPLPRLGLHGSVPLGTFEIAAKVAGLYAELGDFEGYTLEADIGVAWRPLRNFGLVGGYRAITTDIEFKNDNFSLTFQGPYVGAELRF